MPKNDQIDLDRSDGRKVTSVDTLLYTTEADDSKKQSEQEKKVPDPPREEALAVLQDDISPLPQPCEGTEQ